jgi:small nuclear ribonucleoprotein F
VAPKAFLQTMGNQRVSVKLKWGMEYTGRLVSADTYMNLQLADTEEFVDGAFAGNLGEVLIRCNNVLYIRAAPAPAAAPAAAPAFAAPAAAAAPMTE